MPEVSEQSSDQDLVVAVNAGQTQAFDLLYHRHRDWVLRMARRFTGHNEDALDVLQKTFAYLARKFSGIALSAAMRTFLYPAVKNLSIAARRKRQRAAGSPDRLVEVPNTGQTPIQIGPSLLRFSAV